MICIIEPSAHCVWGLGKTAAEAWNDAYVQINRFKSENPGTTLGSLEVATLKRGAPLERSGQTLWTWVDYKAPQQGELL